MRFRGKKKLKQFFGGFILLSMLICLTSAFFWRALLVFALVVLVVFLLIKILPILTHNKPDKNANILLADTSIDGDGTYRHEIVGESKYKDQLREIMSLSNNIPGRCETRANLVFEDNNPYDPQAVMVCINGKTVGYLSRTKALSFRKKYHHYGTIFTCNALLLGGDAQRKNIGVWLDI